MYTGFLAATSNRTRWSFTCNVIDPSTEAALDITGATITIALRAPEQSHAILTGTTSNGRIVLTTPLSGEFVVTFPASDMKTLIPGEYACGLVMVLPNGDEQQLLAASLPVVDGVIDP